MERQRESVPAHGSALVHPGAELCELVAWYGLILGTESVRKSKRTQISNTNIGCPVIPSRLNLAMQIWIFTKTLRFALGNVFAFHPDPFAQYPFPGLKYRFEFGPSDRVTDPPDRQKEFICGLELLPSQSILQRLQQIKARGRQVGGVPRVIDWTDSKFLQTSGRFPGSVRGGVVHVQDQLLE
jgi:hypothetical protein